MKLVCNIATILLVYCCVGIVKAVTADECWINVTTSGDCTMVDCSGVLPQTSQYELLLLEHLAPEIGRFQDVHVVTVSRVTHEANSRTPIMTYPLGGLACVMAGSLRLVRTSGSLDDMDTDYAEAGMGECLALPPNVPISLVNEGEEEAVFVSYSVILVPEGSNLSGLDDDVSIAGSKICEESDVSLDTNDSTSLTERLQVSCESWEECLQEVFEASCGLYNSCNPDDSPITKDYSQSCLNDCQINGKPVPTISFDIPNRNPGDFLGRSVNNGETIPTVASWAVQAGFSGAMVNTSSSGSGSIEPDQDDYYLVELTTRLPGTRAVIHSHDYGGITCLFQGEMTLLLDHLEEVVTRRAGDCYWMPSKRFMTGMNTGNVTARMWDIFVLPDQNKVEQQVLPLTPKELVTNQPQTVQDAAEMVCAENSGYDPLIPETLDRCCSGTNLQNETTAQVLGWVCPVATDATESMDEDLMLTEPTSEDGEAISPDITDSIDIDIP